MINSHLKRYNWSFKDNHVRNLNIVNHSIYKFSCVFNDSYIDIHLSFSLVNHLKMELCFQLVEAKSCRKEPWLVCIELNNLVSFQKHGISSNINLGKFSHILDKRNLPIKKFKGHYGWCDLGNYLLGGQVAEGGNNLFVSKNNMLMGELNMFLSQSQDILEHIREEDMDFAWSLQCGQKIMENLLFILVNLCFQSNL